MANGTLEKERDQLHILSTDMFKEYPKVQILPMESTGADSWIGLSIFMAIDPIADNSSLALRFRALLVVAKDLEWNTSPSRRDALLKNPKGTLDHFYSLVIRKSTSKPKLKIRKE